MMQSDELELAKARREECQLKLLEAQREVRLLELGRPVMSPESAFVESLQQALRAYGNGTISKKEYLTEQDRLMKSLISSVEERSQQPRYFEATLQSSAFEVIENSTLSKAVDALASVASTLQMLAAEFLKLPRGDDDQAAVAA